MVNGDSCFFFSPKIIFTLTMSTPLSTQRRRNKALVIGTLAWQGKTTGLGQDLARSFKGSSEVRALEPSSKGLSSARAVSCLVVSQQDGPEKIRSDPVILHALLSRKAVLKEAYFERCIENGAWETDFDDFMLFGKEILARFENELHAGLKFGISSELDPASRTIVKELLKLTSAGFESNKQDVLHVMIVPSEKRTSKQNESKKATRILTFEKFLSWIFSGSPVAVESKKEKKKEKQNGENNPEDGQKMEDDQVGSKNEAHEEKPTLSSSSSMPEEKKSLDAQSKSKRFVIVPSGIKAQNELDVIVAACKSLPKSKLLSSTDELFADQATHVVLPSLSETLRTIKVANGIAQGKWIVSASWLYRSLECGFWVAEEGHEASDIFPGCKKFRKLRETGKLRKSKSLDKLTFSIDRTSMPPKKVITKLVQEAGGTIVDDPAKSQIIICGEKALAQRQANHEQGIVSSEWIFDGLSTGEFEMPKLRTPSPSNAIQKAATNSKASAKKVSASKVTTKPKKAKIHSSASPVKKRKNCITLDDVLDDKLDKGDANGMITPARKGKKKRKITSEKILAKNSAKLAAALVVSESEDDEEQELYDKGFASPSI